MDSRNYLKEQILEAQGKNISLDYFLYSCFEFEKTRRARQTNETKAADAITAKENLAKENSAGDHSTDQHEHQEVAHVNDDNRWPILFDLKINSLPAAFAAEEFSNLLKKMFIWYASKYPEMTEDIALDHDQLNLLLEPFLNLTFDLNDLFFLKHNTSLPKIDPANAKSVAIWSVIQTQMFNDFPAYADYFFKFLEWTFSDSTPEEIVEVGSRPPVGKFAPSFKQRNASKGLPPDNRGPGNNRDRNFDRNNNQNRGGFQNKQPGQGQRPNQGPNRGPRNNHPNPRNSSAPRVQRGPQQPFPQKNADSELEQIAYKSVDDAIAKLNTDPSCDEVFLKPMNSFYRRIQHQYAVDKGYDSCSVGDGPERGVKVARKV